MINMRINTFLAFTFLVGSLLKAQDSTRLPYFQTNTNIELSFAALPKQASISLAFNKYHGIGKKKAFKIGYGLRWTSYFAGKQGYKTAPAMLTSGVNNPSALFRDNIVANIDTIYFTQSQVHYLNALVSLQYTFKGKLDLEFNIDVLGFSFGPKQNGVYRYSDVNFSNSSAPQNASAKPSTFNLLLVSDNDLGSLNSELLLRYRINKIFAIKFGAAFQFIESTTDIKWRLNNDRFRYKSLMPMIGMSYWL
jgi:hypothetical protein